MARYRILTPEQHRDFCHAMLLLSHTDQHLCEWMPKDRVAKLKEASRLITEVIVETTFELSKDSARRLKKNLLEVDLFCLPKPEAQRKIRENKRINVVRIREEALMTLLESALHFCKYPCGRNYKSCELRKVALELEVPKWNPEARGYCPYEQRKDDDKNEK